jgi:hypothetical protein
LQCRRDAALRYLADTFPFVSQLITAPRRPEIALSVHGTIRIGVVRPAATFQSTLVYQSSQRQVSCRITLSRRHKSIFIAALRSVFAKETWNTAINVVQERHRGELQQHTRSYFSGFCPVLISPRKVRLTCVLRFNLFVELLLSFQDIDKIPASVDGDLVSLHSCMTADLLLDLIIPSFQCPCKPRIGESPAKSTPAGRKLCRHVIQVTYKYFQEFVDIVEEVHGDSSLPTGVGAQAPAQERNGQVREGVLLIAGGRNLPPEPEAQQGCPVQGVLQAATEEPKDYARILQW